MNVLFGAMDAGGANAIAPVLRTLAQEGVHLEGVTEGPASRILSDIPSSPLAGAPDVLLLGTSAGDAPEKCLLKEHPQVPSVSVLDFWANYWQRFSSAGEKDFAYLPTRICVIDDIARDEMIAEGFPAERLLVTGNPHFDHFADAITTTAEDAHRILFISQPLSVNASMRGFSAVGYDEHATVNDIIEALALLPQEYYLSLRLHPKEAPDTYAELLGPRVRRATEATLEEAVSASNLIVGMSSPVLMQAAAAGKKVLSYEPNLPGADPLVSNRAGVTTRIADKAALADALSKYARGEWPFANRPLREVWPAGATARVLQTVRALAKRYD